MFVLNVCIICLFFLLSDDAYLGGGECNVTAMSHVTELCQVSEMVCQPTVVGSGCQRWLAMDANGGWHWIPTVVGNANHRWQSHVIRISIYRPRSFIGNAVCF